MVVFTVLGVVSDPEYYHCETVANKLAETVADVKVNSWVGFEVDYWLKIDEFKDKVDPTLMHYEKLHFVAVDGRVIGDVEAFSKYVNSQYECAVDPEVANTVLYNRNVREGFFDRIKHNENPIVYIQFGLQDLKRSNEFEVIGGLHIELFKNMCPKASENFENLCGLDPKNKSKYNYTGCFVNRLVRNGWFQTGDVVEHNGKSSETNDGNPVPDESFSIDFGGWRGGMIGYANEGAHSNKSQFFITLGACPWMNHKFVGFGRVIQGYSLLRKINSYSTNNQVPARAIKITYCGQPPELKEGK